MAANDDKNDDEKDLREKNRQLKKKKKCLKQAIAKARACQQTDQDNHKAATGADSPVSLPPPGSLPAGAGSPIPPAFLRFPSSFGLFAINVGSPILLTPMGLLATGVASAIGPFATFYLGFFNPICLMPFSPNNCHTTFISPFS